MKISFVIPAYNEEVLLRPCLQAVLEHTAKSGVPTEVIVVNNASTDNTGAVAASFSGVIVVNEPRKGLARARRSGFEASSGELIANIDADTIMDAHWIPYVLESFQKDPNLVGLSGPHSFYDIPKWRQLLAKSFYGLAYLNYILHKHILGTASFMQGGNFVVRRTALEKVGGFDPSFSFYGEDADISQRLHKVGDVRFTFSLPLRASGRRLVMEGYVHMAWVYFINYLSAVFLRRAVTTTRTEFSRTPKHSRTLLESVIAIVVALVLIGAIITVRFPSSAYADEHPYFKKTIEKIKLQQHKAAENIKQLYIRVTQDND